MAPQDGLTATLRRADEDLGLTSWRTRPLLRVAGLSVSYGRNEVVSDVGFELGRGESLALIGESGSGKSTIARSVLRLLPAGARASGRVEFEGQDVLKLSERRFRLLRGRRVGYVPQDPGNALNPVRPSAPRRTRRPHCSTSRARRSANDSSSTRSPRSGSTIPDASTIPTRTSCPAACCSAC